MSFLYRALMFAGGLVCHQLPERSPHILGVQLPVCWRCTGILIGSLVFFGWLIVKKKLPPLMLSLLLAIPLPLDVFYAVFTGSDGNNARRLVTGGLWGFFGIALLFGLLTRFLSGKTPSSVASATATERG